MPRRDRSHTSRARHAATAAERSLRDAWQELNRKMEVVRRFLAYKKVPTSLRVSILSYYSFFWSSHQSLDEDTVLVDLPPTLRLHFDIEQTKNETERCPHESRHCQH